MFRLRLPARFCSVHPSSLLANKPSVFHQLHTVKMDLRGNQILENQHPILHQNVIVMRHGERFDNFEPSWASTATRPWDPPLAQPGRLRSFQLGRSTRQSLGFPIHRLFVSPFLRCVQTAAEFINALSTIEDGCESADKVFVDPTRVKVSIEYGLCEMINSIAIRLNVAPKDRIVSFDISELEAIFQVGALDNNVEMVYKEIPKWEESVLEARARYQQTIKSLANKYPTENLLLVTHGEGIQVALSSFKKDVEVNEIQYCGYVQLRRPIFKKDHSLGGGKFNVLTQSGQSGVTYISSQGL